MLLLFLLPLIAAGQSVMPWMCLERCNFTSAEVQDHLADILQHKHLLSRVSFERYNLGPNGTLILNNQLTHVAPVLKSQGNLTTIAMISSYPYPPQFLSWMRFVFQNPIPFLTKLFDQLSIDAIDGVNFDWEPTSPDTTAQDAQDYATFLALAQTFLESRNKIVTVDVATFNRIWNLTAISVALQASSAQVCTMETYTNNDTVFVKNLDSAIQILGPKLLTVGLQTIPGTNVSLRFDALVSRGICRAAVWDMPLDETWWAAIGKFLTDCK